MERIILPRKDENGEYYISYSQYTSFIDEKSFNLPLVSGKVAYMKSYFYGLQFPDAGWAQFGKDVEDYICERLHADKFTDKEKVTLDQVEPLGNFQIEVKFYILPGVYIKGYIDDATEDLSLIRDYKTASNNSREKYYKDNYTQLDIYAMYVKELTGKIPQLEVCIIERTGNCFGMVDKRELLKVGTNLWYHTRDTNDLRLESIKNKLITEIHEISELYKLFLRMQNLEL